MWTCGSQSCGTQWVHRVEAGSSPGLLLWFWVLEVPPEVLEQEQEPGQVAPEGAAQVLVEVGLQSPAVTGRRVAVP